MAIDLTPVIAPKNYTYTDITGELATITGTQARFYRSKAPIQVYMYGALGSSGNGDSAIIPVAGRSTLIVQAVGTGTFTCYGSLDGVNWVSIGTATTSGLTALSSPCAYLKVTSTASSGTYQVYLLAY